jgi:hypothetical protein
MKSRLVLALLSLLLLPGLKAADSILVEAEAFAEPGGWMRDTQFVLTMGSPYLLAHGLGTPVADASTTVTFPAPGAYRLFVRTKNWTGAWKAEGAPGKFRVLVDGEAIDKDFGITGEKWGWEAGGVVAIANTEVTLALRDLTGFDGRCDALFFTSDPSAAPPSGGAELLEWRNRHLGLPAELPTHGPYDLVVVGGGYSGLGAAVSAARQGCKVALIQDRPVLGGNGSSEIRVWAQGGTRRGKYPRLGEIIEEFADHAKDSPGRQAEFTDEEKEATVRAEKTIDLYLNHFAFDVETFAERLTAVHVLETTSGARKRITGALFADTTGHGTIGAFAGADFEMTEEGHLGMSNMWSWRHVEEEMEWPATPWALPLKIGDFPATQASRGPGEKYFKGEWFWEGGFDKHPIDDLELIRDWNLRAVFGAFTAMKHGEQAAQHATAKLEWVAYIGGNRESRRLMGDVLLTQDDIVGKRDFPDGCVPTTWDIDLHYPKEEFVKGAAKENPFISRAEFGRHVDRQNGYPVPYRCFYSRNIENLFMAGRNISVTHQALGTIRVMRTCGMMGEVVGKAAYLATVNNTTPRGVYENYLPQLIDLFQQPGVARRDSLDGPLYVPEGAEPPPLEVGPGIASASLEGLVVDDEKAKFTGTWGSSTGLQPNVDSGYHYATADGKHTAEFRIRVKQSGDYDLRYYWVPHENRTKHAEVTVTDSTGTSAVTLDLTAPPDPALKNSWRSLGIFRFLDVLDGTVHVAGTAGGFLHVDAIQLVPVK